MIRALQVILPGSIGAAAALATLWLLGGEHDEQPPLRDVGSTSSTDIEEGARHPDEVRALERRIAELELRQRSDSLAATVASEDVEPGSVSPVPPIRVDEQQDEYVYFESRVAQFEDEIVDPEWRDEVEPLIRDSVVRVVDGTSVEFEGIECRQSTCRIDFISTDPERLLEIQGTIAATHHGVDCTTLVVAHRSDSQPPEQRLTALFECPHVSP